MSNDARLFRRNSSILNGLTAFGAGMVAMMPMIPVPPFWRGLLTGISLAVTLGVIGLHVWIQARYRQTR